MWSPMPIKHNLNKYDLLKEDIYKVAGKEKNEYTNDDKLIYTTAVLIASFASGHSWKTHKVLVNGNCSDLKSDEIKEEFEMAKNLRWKTVNSFDISEISQKNIPQAKFISWLYYTVERKEYENYKEAWANLKKKLEVSDSAEKILE